MKTAQGNDIQLSIQNLCKESIFLSELEMNGILPLANGINRLIHGIDQLINGITRFIDGITRLIYGISWLINGWGHGPGRSPSH